MSVLNNHSFTSSLDHHQICLFLIRFARSRKLVYGILILQLYLSFSFLIFLVLIFLVLLFLVLLFLVLLFPVLLFLVLRA